MTLDDQKYIRLAIKLAQAARDNGNHPFGALLVSPDGKTLLEAGNTVVTEKDSTGHAETNLVRMASSRYDRDFLSQCTLYTSTEPCPMCSGAIFWANIGRVVYGLSEESFYEIVGQDSEEVLYLPCRELFARGRRHTEVVGPILESVAREVHRNFWD
ncbi:MAG: nucleoside deaminase [Anaerolineales bacterium]